MPSALPPEGAEHSGIILVCPAPDAADEQRGFPMKGPRGSLLAVALSKAGLRPDRVAYVPLCSCRGEAHDLEEASFACAMGLEHDLAKLAGQGYSHVLALGKEAFEALGFEGSLRKLRGSIFNRKGPTPLVVVPTFAPENVPGWGKRSGSGRADAMLTFVADMEKLKGLAEGTIKQAEEDFLLDPSFDQARIFLEGINAQALLGIDIESDGLSRFNSDIVCIGFATSPSRAMVLPWNRAHGVSVWSPREEELLKGLVGQVFSRASLVFQNAAFDVPFLRLKGFDLPVSSVAHDTFLLHSVLAPEQEHNLGYITSVYGSTSYWKDSFANRPGSIYDMDRTELWTYNARDSCVLLQVLGPLMEDAGRLGSLPDYLETTMPLFGAVLEMEERGVKFDYARLGAFSALMDREIAKQEDVLYELAGLPRSFDFGKPVQLRLFLYGWKPKWFKTVPAELDKRTKELDELRRKLDDFAEQAAASKKKPATIAKMRATLEASLARKESTAKLFELRERANLLGVEPLHVPSGWEPPLTKEGEPSTGKEGLLSLRIALQNELEELDARDAKHEATLAALEADGKGESPLAGQRREQRAVAQERAVRIERVLSLLEGLSRRTALAKLKAAFCDYRPAPDGRIHPWWNAGGAATGRMSCSDPNLMQLPKRGEGKEVRRFFVAEDGNCYVSADKLSLSA